MPNNSLFAESHLLLLCTDSVEKVQGIAELYKKHLDNKLTYDWDYPVNAEVIGGLPPTLQLVSPKTLTQRKLHTPLGQAAMVHAIMHIEFNAINLALDALYRFRDMPLSYYADWLKVTREEAYHFHLLEQHLTTLGYRYGDFPAHNSLWEMAEKTGYDVLARMALVPRLMEARGLDVAPQVAARLAKAGNKIAAEIMSIIFEDEKGHVAIGNHWYHHLCCQRKLPPLETFKGYLEKHAPDFLRGPLAMEARLQSGFSHKELLFLQQLITTS